MASHIGDVSSSNQKTRMIAISNKHKITYEGPIHPQKQVSLSTFGASAEDTNTSSSSCPDSPIRRVSSSLRNSAVELATRFFNKCRAATFNLDGANYKIGKLLTKITEFSINNCFKNKYLSHLKTQIYLYTLQSAIIFNTMIWCGIIYYRECKHCRLTTFLMLKEVFLCNDNNYISIKYDVMCQLIDYFTFFKYFPTYCNVN